MKQAILVAVLAALGFLALRAATGGIEATDSITAVAAGAGAAIGFHYGTRRRERKKSGR